MYILVTYDVDTTEPAGAKRLRSVARICQDYGQRVQNSVFECSLSEENFVFLKGKLASAMDSELDSIRIYHLGKNWQNKIEEIGKKTSFNIEGSLII